MDILQLHAEQRAGEYEVVTTVIHKEFDGGGDFLALLDLVEEDQRIPWLHRFVGGEFHAHQYVVGFAWLAEHTGEVRVFNEIEFDQMLIVGMCEFADKVRFADLAGTVNEQRRSVRRIVP